MALFGLSKLFGGSQLTVLERRVTAAVSAKLPTSARHLFDAQINQINRIQRHSSGKEANFYVMRRGKPFIEERFLFPHRSETLLATVHLNSGEEKKPLRAEVWLVNGHVFSVNFNKPPGKASEDEIHVIHVEILHDPMISTSEETIPDSQRREKVLKTLQSKLPHEYMQLVGEGSGITVNEWTVSGIQGIRKIVQRDGSYYVLAEKEGMGAIGVKEDEFSGQLYYLDYGDDCGEKIAVTLRRFLEEFDGGRVAGRF